MANELVIARDFFARESVTLGATSIGLTAATYSPGTTVAGAPTAQFALMALEGDQIRQNPIPATDADSADILVQIGDIIELHGINNIRNFRAIRVTGDATLRVQYAR